MLTIEFDTTALKAVTSKLEEMQDKISELQHTGIPDELSDWQTEDMHRKRAFTKHTRIGARTTIRPHSLYEMRRSRKVFQRYARRQRRKGRYVTPLELGRVSTRPILRAMLLDRLYDRMAALAVEKLKW